MMDEVLWANSALFNLGLIENSDRYLYALMMWMSDGCLGALMIGCKEF